ncbi:MAG: HEAT repeat domain-containing protein, partial [Blastocatellia bacterium]
MYKLLNEEADDENEWKSYVQTWLRRNSAYFRDELIKSARAADDNYDSIEDLRALAKLDWGAAKPILETFASAGKPHVTPVTLSLLYKHAMENGDSAQAESYRAHLKAIVANRRAPHYARGEALSSLTSDEWSGQEEWFVSLFSDPTLSGGREESGGAAKSEQAPNVKLDDAVESTTVIGHDGITAARHRAARLSDKSLEALQNGILATALDAGAGKWLPVVGSLVGHNQREVHDAAVKCLVEFLAGQSGAEGKEAARRLSPWLMDPNWARREDRLSFISNLADLKAPELIPGLVWVLEHDEAPDNRVAAAEALTQYRDPRAVPALRRALENDEYEENREKIVTALAECGGFSDDEMAAAIEAYARVVITEKGEQEIDRARYGGSDEPLPLKVSVGRILSESETIQATEGLAVRLLERAKALRAKQPAVARQILRTIEGAPLRVAEINLVERIGEGWADVDSITLALETRDTLGKSAGDELYGLIKQGGYAAGVAAAVLNEEREWKAAFESGDAKFQLALLACARYLRDKLPVELAGKLLNSSNRALAKAAESYLEVEDSAEARKLVLARHPGEAYILGDLTAISSDDAYIESVRSWEDALRKETQGQNGLEAIYA